MSEQKHTQEPWEAITPCPDECCWHIQQVGNDNHMDTINNPEMSRYDARRIVACVNVCAGIPIEILEQKQSGGLTWSFASTLELIMQRDELLAALKRLEDKGWLNHILEMAQSAGVEKVGGEIKKTVCTARAAIAKAEAAK